MKYLHLAIIALVSGLVLTAHAAAPKDSGYLSDYDRLIEGEYLEAYWVDIGQIRRSAAPSMLLREISVAGIKHHKGVTVADCVGWLKRDLPRGGCDFGQSVRCKVQIRSGHYPYASW